jgi:phosphotriesterase-related protein
MPLVETVCGPVPPDSLGITLAHEHLLLDARPAWREPDDEHGRRIAHAPVTPTILHALRQNPYLNLDNCALEDEQLAAAEAAHFAACGGATIVDATCLGIGRDPQALVRISRATGLNIVMGTGFYLERTHPGCVHGASPEALSARMVRDLAEGEGGVKAGYIGEIGVSRAFTAAEEKVLRAAARAQSATGVALSVHLPGWERYGHRVLDIVAEEGGDLSRTILDHMNPSGRDLDYQTSLADRGAYLEYDMIGMDFYFATEDAQCPCDEENARAIARLVERGYAERVLLSHDVFLKMMLTHYGGNGYAYISRHFVPRLRRQGVTQTAIDTVLVTNPARVFGGL